MRKTVGILVEKCLHVFGCEIAHMTVDVAIDLTIATVFGVTIHLVIDVTVGGSMDR